MVIVYTVGHSNLPVDRFIALLKSHAITAVADIRSHPASRFSPQFNRPALTAALAQHNIDYVFLGRELGARPDDSSCYEHGKVQYRRLEQSARFLSGIECVLANADSRRLTLMCTEKDPLNCHRTLLVGRALESKGARMVHILAGGHSETGDQAMQRLLTLVCMPEDDLFSDRDDRIATACALREQQIAFNKPTAHRSRHD